MFRLSVKLFGLLETAKKRLEDKSLLVDTTTYLERHSKVEAIVAIDAAYRPHGGREFFWFYLADGWWDCHAAHHLHRGGVRVRHIRVPHQRIWVPIEESRFFDMNRANSEVIDGLRFEIVVSERLRSHSVQGDGLGLESNQPQTKLFYALIRQFDDQFQPPIAYVTL